MLFMCIIIIVILLMSIVTVIMMIVVMSKIANSCERPQEIGELGQKTLGRHRPDLSLY